jgi:hypothetical protein
LELYHPMPKKTKRQKIEATKHRGNGMQNAQQKGHELHAASEQESKKGFVYTFSPTTTTKPKQIISQDDIVHLSVIKRDLLKTVILTILCCGIVVGLSIIWK